MIVNDTVALTAGRNVYGALNDGTSDLSDLNRGTYGLTVHGALNRARASSAVGTVGAATTLFGSYNQALTQSSSTTTVANSYASYNLSRNTGSPTVTNAYGNYNYVQQNNAASTTTSAFGVRSQITNTAGTMTNAYALYGAYSGTIGTKWGAYITGEDKNYFSGNVGIGNTAPGAKLDVTGNVNISGAITSSAGTIRDSGGGWFPHLWQYRLV